MEGALALEWALPCSWPLVVMPAHSAGLPCTARSGPGLPALNFFCLQVFNFMCHEHLKMDFANVRSVVRGVVEWSGVVQAWLFLVCRPRRPVFSPLHNPCGCYEELLCTFFFSRMMSSPYLYFYPTGQLPFPLMHRTFSLCPSPSPAARHVCQRHQRQRQVGCAAGHPVLPGREGLQHGAGQHLQEGKKGAKREGVWG